MGIASNNPANVSAGVCTSTTRPNNPYEGQMVYVTDLDELQVWNGAVWFTLYVDITPIEAAIDALEADVTAIDGTLTTYGSNIATNASAVATINSQLTVFQSQINANASAIAAVGDLPTGGNAGDLLVKGSPNDFDATFQPVGTVAVPISTINAKGDLLVGTANDAVTRQAVGADGETLVADSMSPTGLSWTQVVTVTTQEVNSKAVAMALVFG